MRKYLLDIKRYNLNSRNRIRSFFILFAYTFVLTSCFQKKSYRYISNASVPLSEREAILILPGFGSIVHGNKKQLAYFSNKGYDVHIPKYIKRKSISACVKRLDSYYKENNLAQYKKVHVFSYIVGSWVLNTYLNQTPQSNIETIQYDRSPLQERAPYVLTHDSPFLARIVGGKIMWNFRNTPYPPLQNSKAKIGILVESKATDLIRKHKRTTMSLGELNWDVSSFKQPYSDYMYIRLNHDEMYFKLDVIGDQLFQFIKNGSYSSDVQRIPYNWDYFLPYK
ncbi:MAG: hypothetical protein J0M08_09735 [Bacteroidetes bacterium]|nr:hypothetical protein [Bacteroidota bacterium]